MKSSRSNPLKSVQESLAESLRQAVPPKSPDSTAAGVTKKGPAESTAALPRRLGRTTITVRGADQDKVDQILALLLQRRRHRGGVTEAVCIALRLCPLDPDQIERVWDTIRAEDGRIKRGKK